MSVFLICLATATLEKNRLEKKHLFIFLVCFSHLPCYGYIGEKQTRKKTYLSFSSVFLICLATATLEKKRQEKHIYLSFSSVFLICLGTTTLEKNRQEKHIYLSFLSVFFSSALLRLHWRKTGNENAPIYLSCLFFVICLLTATLERNRQEKIDTGGKNRQGKRVWGLKYETVVYISPFLSISCNVHTQVVQTSHFYPPYSLSPSL